MCPLKSTTTWPLPQSPSTSSAFHGTGHVGVFQVKPLRLHILKAPLNRPLRFVGLKDNFGVAYVGAHHHPLAFAFLAHNQELAVIDFFIKDPFLTILQMDEETPKISFPLTPLNQSIVFDADKKGML